MAKGIIIAEEKPITVISNSSELVWLYKKNGENLDFHDRMIPVPAFMVDDWIRNRDSRLASDDEIRRHEGKKE